MTFLVVALNTHAKTAKLNIPSLQPGLAQQKISLKNDLFLRLSGVLTTYPYKLRQKFSLALGVHLHPLHPLATPMRC